MPWRPWEDVLALVELAAPTACAGCGLAGQRWCRRCAAVLGGTAPRPWTPTPSPPGMPPTWAGPAYVDEVRAAVVAWKDGGRADLTAQLAPVLRDVLATALDGSPAHRGALRSGELVAVVPAPSSPASVRARGEHRVASLAGAALGRRARPLCVVDALRLSRHVADQAGLGSAQRWRNLAGAVRVRRDVIPRLRGVPCVVVDDVVTTGATLVECARALREAGSGPVIAVTVAATQRSAARRETRGAPSTPPLPPGEGSD